MGRRKKIIDQSTVCHILLERSFSSKRRISLHLFSFDDIQGSHKHGPVRGTPAMPQLPGSGFIICIYRLFQVQVVLKWPTRLVADPCMSFLQKRSGLLNLADALNFHHRLMSLLGQLPCRM
jgi:hypothetical protein